MKKQQPIDGPLYTHTLASRIPPEGPFTITNSWCVPWWKRPWYWLRRKPTKVEITYRECEVKSIHVLEADEATVVSFDIRVPPQCNEIDVYSDLTPDEKGTGMFGPRKQQQTDG